MNPRIIALLALVSLLVGCATSASRPVSVLLPQQANYDADALDRQEPEVRYANFERQYREGTKVDEYWPLAAKYEGIGQLVMPPSASPQAVWAYISLGKDFAAKGDDGGAARAYWAALELVSRTIASRPDRERIIRAAFYGLEGVAEARGQRRWGKLMRFSAHLADEYLASPQAAEDNAAFYGQMNVIREAQQGLEGEKAKAKRQLWLGLITAAGAGVGAAGAWQASNSQAFEQFATQGLMQLGGATDNYDKVKAKIEEMNEKYSEHYQSLRRAAAGDVEEIEAGNSFVANSLKFYVQTAKSPQPYLQLLKRFARNKPRLKEVLASYGDEQDIQVTPESLKQIQDELVQIELFVAKYERRGKVTPSELATAVWPD